MNYYKTYNKKYKSNEIAMLRMIIIKLKAHYNVKTDKELGKILNIEPGVIRSARQGNNAPSKELIYALCFNLGITKEFLEQAVFEASANDIYVNSNQQLIIDGINYGSINIKREDYD